MSRRTGRGSRCATNSEHASLAHRRRACPSRCGAIPASRPIVDGDGGDSSDRHAHTRRSTGGRFGILRRRGAEHEQGSAHGRRRRSEADRPRGRAGDGAPDQSRTIAIGWGVARARMGRADGTRLRRDHLHPAVPRRLHAWRSQEARQDLRGLRNRVGRRLRRAHRPRAVGADSARGALDERPPVDHVRHAHPERIERAREQVGRPPRRPRRAAIHE